MGIPACGVLSYCIHVFILNTLVAVTDATARAYAGRAAGRRAGLRYTHAATQVSTECLLDVRSYDGGSRRSADCRPSLDHSPPPGVPGAVTGWAICRLVAAGPYSVQSVKIFCTCQLAEQKHGEGRETSSLV